MLENSISSTKCSLRVPGVVGIVDAILKECFAFTDVPAVCDQCP